MCQCSTKYHNAAAMLGKFETWPLAWFCRRACPPGRSSSATSRRPGPAGPCQPTGHQFKMNDDVRLFRRLQRHQQPSTFSIQDVKLRLKGNLTYWAEPRGGTRYQLSRAINNKRFQGSDWENSPLSRACRRRGIVLLVRLKAILSQACHGHGTGNAELEMHFYCSVPYVQCSGRLPTT